MEIPPGKLVLLQDLEANPQQFDKATIRVTGRLVSYDPSLNKAVITYRNVLLHLDTELIEMNYKNDTLIQCIGEVEYNKELEYLILRPRVTLNADDLDMELYEKTVQLLQQYEKTYYL
ncbi:telomere-capping, CST complex subunit-domain-containing protein, partial [Cunninghamella echinulata]